MRKKREGERVKAKAMAHAQLHARVDEERRNEEKKKESDNYS